MTLLERLEKQKSVTVSEKEQTEKIITKNTDVYRDIKAKIHKEVIEQLNKRNLADTKTDLIKQVIDEVIEEVAFDIGRTERSKIASELLNDVIGYGPLEDLLNDPNISEIMVNGPYTIYVERSGKIELSQVTFRDLEHELNIIDRIVSPLGRHIDEASPMVDARLKDGSRVNIIIPPLSLVGPVITIRKFSKEPITAQNLLGFGSLSPKMLNFLEACVKGRLNIIVSGGTGSGKTTLLNVLSTFIPEDERIVTIEDAAELQLRQKHVITLESRTANMEGKGQISIRDLVRNALRMRPDRIIVGEVRSGETLDMLQAMNTGHDGSLTTTHANTPRDTLSRIETMVLMSGMDLPVRAIREQVSSAIDIIVQQSRMRDGSRKITNITEVLGMENDIIILQDIFVCERDSSVDGSNKIRTRFKATGIRPHCVERIKNNNIYVNDDWFRE
ncbi:MAG: CpaF family protein [Clostridiales bacterium]|nr:CpaF family protein [Clostridiales bacterium]